MEEMLWQDQLGLQGCRGCITPRGHFPMGFDKGSGLNFLEHGAAEMGWQGDGGLSGAGELMLMPPGIRVPVSLPAPTAPVPHASASPAFPWVPLDKRWRQC